MKKVIIFGSRILLICVIAAAFVGIFFQQKQQMQVIEKLEQQQILREKEWESQISLLQNQLQTQQSQLQEAGLQMQEGMEQIQLQQETILQLQATLERLIQATRGELGTGGEFVLNCSPETFDYLAIGNSITIHDTCDYWPNTSGMSASSPENDYFHLVSAGLEESKGTVNSYALSLFAWEVVATDRAEMAELTDTYLTEDLDLVTIQLGENAQDLETFLDDYVYLIRHIQQYAPNAKILALGDFWDYENRELLKMQGAQLCDVTFVSLEAIMEDPAYQAGQIVKVVDQYGQIHEIQHSGVAKHPSDEAMMYIAQAILSALQ